VAKPTGGSDVWLVSAWREMFGTARYHVIAIGPLTRCESAAVGVVRPMGVAKRTFRCGVFFTLSWARQGANRRRSHNVSQEHRAILRMWRLRLRTGRDKLEDGRSTVC
jgi:hypothetical protein